LLLFFSGDVLYLFIPKTANDMIVYNAGGLHVGIHNYAAQKPESPLFHVRRNFVRQLRSGRQLRKAFPFSGYLFTLGKTPDIGRKTAKLFLNFQKFLGVVNRRLNL
jgi:hypothetical protein